MAKIDSLMVTSPSDYTLTDDYKTFIESMLDYLRHASVSDILTIEPSTAYLYRFDLTAFLIDNNVDLEDHYLIMRVNGIDSPNLFDETYTQLIIPKQALITQLQSVYRTRGA